MGGGDRGDIRRESQSNAAVKRTDQEVRIENICR